MITVVLLTNLVADVTSVEQLSLGNTRVRLRLKKVVLISIISIHIAPLHYR